MTAPRPAKPGPQGQDALGHVTPRTYEELRAVLSSGTRKLPKRLRQVAIFLWQHPNDVALGSISSLAAQIGVQPSTLVRFAQVFGYSGFSDLQAIFKDHAKVAWSARDDPGAVGGRPTAVSGLIAASRASLSRLEGDFDSVRFDAVARALATAGCVHLIGSKRAFPVAAYLSLTMSQFGVRNVLVDNVGSTAFDHVACLGVGDVVLAISFSPYNSITPDLVTAAHERRVRIVSMTDSTFSPLLRHSEAYVEVVETSYAGFRSVAATFALGMALVLAVVEARGV